MKMTGAQALIKSLEMEGVEVMFGLPGGAILPVYDPHHRLVDPPHPRAPRAGRRPHGRGLRPRHRPPRRGHGDERPGGHQHRHAAVRRLHGLDPDRRASPARCRTPAIGTDAFQECDTVGITMPVTKHNWLVTDAAGHPADRPRGVPRRHHRPARARCSSTCPRTSSIQNPDRHGLVLARRRRPARLQARPPRATRSRSRRRPSSSAESHRPVIYAGGGILKARAAEALRELAELTGIPVVTTLMARGAFPDDHALCLGMPGMHGNYTAVTSMQKADLLIALGIRFDDRVTGKVDAFAPDAKIIHVDIDPAELGKVRRPDVPIVGDCRLVIEELVKAVRDLGRRRGPARPHARGSSHHQRLAGAATRSLRAVRAGEPAQAAVRARDAARQHARRHDRRRRASASTRCGRASTGSSTTRTRG